MGFILDFGGALIQIPEVRVLKLKSSLVSCLQNNQIIARDLASVTGQIISMACTVGNVKGLFTRNCYAAVDVDPPGISPCMFPLRFITNFPFS